MLSSRFSPGIGIVTLATLVTLASASLVACVSGGAAPVRRSFDDDAGNEPATFEAGSPADVRFELPEADPHALIGVSPGHGSFQGGESRIVRGRGFTVDARVWFGANEIPQSAVLPLDEGRLQIVAPAGAPGPVDVSAQLGDDASTRRTLTDGYVYDLFYADPKSGPTSGGTVVHLHGQGTHWDAASTVTVGDAPCTGVIAVSSVELMCTLPKSAPGAKSITVTAGDGTTATVLDAYTFGDSDNGFRGGLSGGPLTTQLTVLAFNSYTDEPISGVTVIAAAEASGALTQHTDSSGITVFQSADLGPARTVTLAAKCFQPFTFVAVPVDRVTAFLDPVLSPACISGGDPPTTGGHGGAAAAVTGQLVWRPNFEFKKDGWRNVPLPASPDEQQAAYVFAMASDPTARFQLPDASKAVHPDAAGDVGYLFSLAGPVGNLALYALAGVENRAVSPPKFTAYAMGVLQGVLTQPSAVTKDVFIPMDITLDQAVTVALRSPTPTPRGPDRAAMSVAVQVGNNGYAIFPVGRRDTLVPVDGSFSFVGLPALTGSLAGSRYVAGAVVATGPTFTTPASLISNVTFTDPSQTVPLDDFVPIPTLVDPGPNGAWNGQHLAISLAAGTSPDLVLYEIESGNGLVNWTVAAPGSSRDVVLPDLGSIVPEGALLSGALRVVLSAARVAPFDYGSLLYRQLGPRGWQAYAFDYFPAHLAP